MPKTKKCGQCAYSRSYANHYDYSMKRLYVRFNRSYKPIGWICPYCNKIELDRNITPYIKTKRKNSKGKSIYVRFRNSYRSIGLINNYGKVLIFQNAQIKPQLRNKPYENYYRHYLAKNLERKSKRLI